MNDVSIGELQRKVDALVSKVDAMNVSMSTLQTNLAMLDGRLKGGAAAVVFIGGFACALFGALATWLFGKHT